MSSNRWAWLGGHATARDEADSTKRARRHRRSATSVDRAAQTSFDTRDRRLFGDRWPFSRG